MIDWKRNPYHGGEIFTAESGPWTLRVWVDRERLEWVADVISDHEDWRKRRLATALDAKAAAETFLAEKAELASLRALALVATALDVNPKCSRCGNPSTPGVACSQECKDASDNILRESMPRRPCSLCRRETRGVMTAWSENGRDFCDRSCAGQYAIRLAIGEVSDDHAQNGRDDE